MYLTVAFIVFAAAMLVPSPEKIRGGIGSVMVGLIWPVLPSFLMYFAFKKFVLKKHGPSPKYFELEVLGCLSVGAVGLALWTFR